MMTGCDIAIVGAGPGGLSAALYAARFCRSTIVFHNQQSRALRIPRCYNLPGFDEGISGPDLIERMTRHAARFGAAFVETTIASAKPTLKGFELVSIDGSVWTSRALILATGINLNQIDLPSDLHEAAIENGVLRYCPVCDGFEHRTKRIGVVGCDVSGAGEALFLRQFSRNVTLLPNRYAELTVAERRDLEATGVVTVTDAITEYRPRLNTFEIFVKGQPDPHIFDVVYPALGVSPRNELARALGVAVAKNGKVTPDAITGLPIKGLYCAGDLVEGLDQISAAIGQGAVVATKAHNYLREQDGRTVQAVLDVDITDD